jgi:hypothetical protein
MGPMAIRAWLSRTNRHLTALLVVLTLAGAVVAHHGLPHQMGGMHGEHSMAAAAMCIGTIAGAVAIIGLVAAVIRRRRRAPRAPRVLSPVVSRLVPTGPVPRARSSPLYLQYAVLRR